MTNRTELIQILPIQSGLLMELTDFFTSRKQTKQPLQDARKEAMFAELHSLLSSGLDFSRSFSLLIEGERNAAGRALLTELYRSVVRGESLGRAFERSERFAPLDCGVLRIGEETGRLDEALAFLADYYGKRIAQRRMVSGAVSYPLIILFTAVVVVIFMVLVIVPMFEQVYSRMGGELPAMTRWTISLSKAFPAYLAVTVFMALGGWFWWRTFGGRPGVQRMAGNLLLRMPLLGDTLRKNMQARFCKLLCLLASSGVPLLQGIDMLRGIITFHPYRTSFAEIVRELEQGSCLSDAMERFGRIYDRRLVVLLRVGEQTGRLPEMLRREGDVLTGELEHRLRSLGGMLEPILILLVGLLVAVILISMYLPMFRLGGIMG